MKIFLLKDFRCKFSMQKDCTTWISNLTALDFQASMDSEEERLACWKLYNEFKKEHGYSVEYYPIALYLMSDGAKESTFTLRVRDTSKILESLKNKILLDDKLQAGVDLKFLGNCDDDIPAVSTSTINMPVRDNKERYPCKHVGIIGSSFINKTLEKGQGIFYGIVTMFITTSSNNLSPQVDEGETTVRVMNKGILDDEDSCNIVIVPKNGNPVKCHQHFLTMHSPVFSAMFRSDMKERSTGTLEISDMTEEGVRALLAYIYYRDDTKPNAKSSIALELLNAGHKYHIPSLESKMVDIFMSKPIQWLHVDVAIRLYIFARNLPSPSGDHLKLKALDVMKTNHSTLPQSPSYKKMFQDTPSAGMELCQFLFKALTEKK